MALRGGWIGLFVLLCGFGAQAETLRWQVGPSLRIADSLITLTLHDGRLLVCASYDPKVPCEIIDPLTSQRRSVPVQAFSVRDAVPLDNGRVFLRSGSLLNPETGSIEPLPSPRADLAQGYARTLSAGRAVFWNGGGDPQRCGVLTFFLGPRRGFVDVQAAQPGTCVADVFDIGKGELLVARTAPDKQGRGQAVEFALLQFDGWKWQVGARLVGRTPLAAFRHGDGILVLLYKGSGAGGSEALFLDAAASAPKVTTFTQTDLKLSLTRRHGTSAFLLFDRSGVLRWDPANQRIARASLPGPEIAEARVVERAGRIVLIDAGGYSSTFALTTEEPPTPSTPCDQAFAYSEAALRSGHPGAVDPDRLLLAAVTSPGCLDWLDRQDRFPESIQVVLETLSNGKGAAVKPEEEAAASVLCTLKPAFAAPLISGLVRTKRLDGSRALALCVQADEQLPVLAAARQGKGVSPILVQVGLPPGEQSLRPWVVPLLLSRESLRREAGPLLLAADARRAIGFDVLRESVCLPQAEPALVTACAGTSPNREAAWQDEQRQRSRSSEHREVLQKFGVATAIIGGLGGLAYLGRNNDGGRALAIGSSAVAGSALGLGLVLPGARQHPAASIIGGFVLGIAGGIAGGLIAANASEKPGATRFATAAVPLGATWLFTVALTVNAW